MEQEALISSISLAVCSILLSIGGLLAVLQKSKCKDISICGIVACTRPTDSEV
jgi:hypothetical protein